MSEVCAVAVPLPLRTPRGAREPGERNHPPPAPELFPGVGPQQLLDRRHEPRRQGVLPGGTAALLRRAGFGFGGGAVYAVGGGQSTLPPDRHWA